MNTTYLIIGIAVVLILLLIVLVVVGLNRKKSKTVSFEKKEDDAPKELTQQEKSGNYQATGGFNFAPAKADEREPEILEGQRLAEPEQPVEQRDNLTEAAEAQELKYVEEQEPIVEPEPVAEEPELATEQEPIAEPAMEEEPDDLPPHEEPVIPGPAEDPEPFEHQEAAFTLGAADIADDPDAELQHEDIEVSEPVAETLAEIAEDPQPEPELDTQEEVEQETGTQELVEEQERVEEEATEAAAAASVTAGAVEAALEQTEVPDKVPADTPPPAEVEDIAPAAGRIGRLRGRLSRSQNVIGQGVLGILTAGDLDEDAWEEIEDTLLMADLGTTVTMNVVDSLRDKIAERGVSSEAEARTMLRETLIEACHPEMDRAIKAMPYQGKPAVILVVGVNGTGKTTTTGKLARVLVSMGHKVLLGAADTFRAAAADQLETWGRRVGATTVRGAEGADPASVAFDAVAKGVEEQADVVLVDTAGRLHTSTGLMDQLGKVKRVVEKKAVVDEVILVLDATVGQNGLTQARVFRDVVDITGVALTKLDGTAKGGIVFQVQEELGVPVKLVGLGEGADDLAPFEVEGFVDALLGTK
ncbi:MAG: signal recognition particle-docking protein FtsY [Corynebacterium sp.]|uniref:signal recognition particle-docking protein FtsY n=1 Tax=Corynebacterium sp. TaxID=1720 RepID=UPI0026E06311|nr:signal recognition particle-docking protein FtsY [Corynebacterium sp.]MDO5668904.1 signal recognition particle-docking protein FtsY [Corynebacterium sp.]